MQDRRQSYYLLYIFLFLFISAAFLFYLDWQGLHRQFVFSVLDVGQGDALFIESPTGTQILVDGGPPKKIQSQLTKIMSPFDRKIDAIIITNPDLDHIGGLSEVLKNYKIGRIFEPGTISDSKAYQNFEAEVKKKNIPNTLVRRGMRLDLGGGTALVFLFPDRDVSTWATNDGSTVAELSYRGNFFMLTGDVPIKTEQMILKASPVAGLRPGENSAENLRSTFLKVSHHGSRSGTSEEFLKTVSPSFALISVGKDNKYGHPHPEVLDLLSRFGAKILRTDMLGAITVKCDTMGRCKINK